MQSGYLIEESGDELNDETFGNLDTEVVAKPNFQFGASHPLPMPPSRPPMSLAGSPNVRRGMTAAELEQQLLLQKPAPVPHHQPHPPVPIAPRRVVLNLDELESSFKASASISPHSTQSPMFSSALHRPISPPPGFLSASKGGQAVNKPAVQITFPKPCDDEDDHGEEPNQFLMTKYEREGIRRIHMAQLTTENPLLEDFYYQAFSKRSLKSQNQSSAPLYLPLPNLKRKPIAKERKETFEGALGKIASSSSRKPRQQLQLDSSPGHQSLNLEDDDISSEQLYLSVQTAIEHLFAAVFKLEDALNVPDEEEVDADKAEQSKAEAREAVQRILNLDKIWGRADILRFVHILSLPKGRKAVFRALRILDHATCSTILERLVEYLEYLTVFRPNTPVQEVESFVNLILSPMVSFISESSSAFTFGLIKQFMEKQSFMWLLFSRPGLILLCILMSRLEICKSSGDVEIDPILAKQWPELSAKLFEHVSERLPDFFSIPTLKSSSPKLAFDGGDFYIWQFIALVALNVDAESKKLMVVELRDRIMAVVQHGSPKDLANLNIFLNVLGLDSSQLAAA